MDHIATAINVDPLELRLTNFNKVDHPLLVTFVNDLVSWADIKKRKEDIKSFNEVS